MRVLIVTDSYPPLIGGATRATHLLARELVMRGHTVTVATISQEGAPARETLDGVDVHRLHGLTLRLPFFSADPYRRNPPPFPDPETVVTLRRLISSFRPAIVHAYGWTSYSCAAAMIGKDTPMLLSARDYGNVCAKRTLVRRGAVCSGPAPLKCVECSSEHYGVAKGLMATAGVLLGRLLLRRKVTALHSVSGYVEGVMNEHLFGGRPPGLERILPDFREDVGDVPPKQEFLDRLPDAPYMLFVGALRRIKGVQELLDAYERLGTDVPLVLIGTQAPDTPTEFPPNVTVLRNVPFSAVLAAWDRALFGIAPSVLAEPLGNVIHEGMSRGRPVIGTTPGGHGDMISEGITGLLVPSGDVKALTDAMRRLLDDSEATRAMGERARESAGRFTVDAVMPGFERLYDEVVESEGRRD